VRRLRDSPHIYLERLDIENLRSRSGRDLRVCGIAIPENSSLMMAGVAPQEQLRRQRDIRIVLILKVLFFLYSSRDLCC
jgi:hypothetical protein